MNLLLFAIIVILLLFLLFYIKSTNIIFYQKYLYFFDDRINIINFGICIILSFIMLQIITSDSFFYKVGEIYIFEEKEFFIRALLFVLYTLLLFKFNNLGFIKDMYSNKVILSFFLLYFLWLPIIFTVYILEETKIYFYFLTLVLYFLYSLFFSVKKQNKSYIIIPIFIFLSNFISIYIAEKTQDYYYYKIKKKSLDNVTYYDDFNFDFPLSFYPTKFFKLNFNGVIKNELFKIYYKNGELLKIEFTDDKIYKDNEKRLMNAISYFIHQNIYSLEEAENKLTSVALESDSNETLKKIFNYPYEIVYIDDKIAYVVNSEKYFPSPYNKIYITENKSFIPSNKVKAFLFEKAGNYLRVNEWEELEKKNNKSLIKNVFEIIKINSKEENYKIFLKEMGVKY